MKVFDDDKTRMIGLPYSKKYDHMLSRFHLIPERYGRTDGRTDKFAISIFRVSMLTRDKNGTLPINFHHGRITYFESLQHLRE